MYLLLGKVLGLIVEMDGIEHLVLRNFFAVYEGLGQKIRVFSVLL